MDLEASLSLPLAFPTADLVQCSNCGCTYSVGASVSSTTWLRSVKRKYDEFGQGNRFFIGGVDLALNPRVEIENECAALRETVSSQQQAIQDLYTELEEERNASSSAANEAMSMILRLQREKAEIQMEARQFKRFAEEKMAHDQQEIVVLEDILYKREQAIHSLTCEVQAYKHRMLSYGLTEAEVEGDKCERGGFGESTSMNENLDAAQVEFPVYDYPPLRCNLNENPTPWEGDDDTVDIEKYAFGETPRGWEKNVLEKVVVGLSPRRREQSRRFSTDSTNSLLGLYREIGSDVTSESPRFKLNNSFKKMDCFPNIEDRSNSRKIDNTSELGDDMNDRVYTIDSVNIGVASTGMAETKPTVGISEDYTYIPRETFNSPDLSDPEIKKLYMRLQALEADRESMRQAIISMRTDKAQLVLLKEIAQNLCKDRTPQRQMPLKKPSIVGSFSFMSVFKWIASFVFWRRRARQSKYTFGLSADNVGLLLLLDKVPARQWRCLTNTRKYD